MYYRITEDGKVLDFSKNKFHEDCLYTDKDIIVAWDGNAYVDGTQPEEPLELVQKRIQTELTDAVQEHLDASAKRLGYDHCNSACTYVDTGVQRFDDEGRAFRAWRSAVWAKTYEIFTEVRAGERKMPTDEELLAMMPKLEISYS